MTERTTTTASPMRNLRYLLIKYVPAEGYSRNASYTLKAISIYIFGG